MYWDSLSLTTGNVLAYLVARGLAGERDAVEVRDLGGGRSNSVLLVEWNDPPGRLWVVKQSPEGPRVKDGCRSERVQIFREAESIRAVGPALGEGGAPEILHIDYDNFLFVMTAAPAGSVVWIDQLLNGERVMLIDWEVVHWGDPAFDTGFLLNHLFLKALHQPQFGPRYFDAVREFWRTLSRELPRETTRGFEALTIRHVGGLMLARIDGKSPVEYIRDEEAKEKVRTIAKRVLREQPQKLEDVIRIVRDAVEQ